MPNEPEEISIVVCGNVDHVVDSEHLTCADCDVDIVLSPTTKLDAGPNAIYLCHSCALIRYHNEPVKVNIGPATLKSLRAHAALRAMRIK